MTLYIETNNGREGLLGLASTLPFLNPLSKMLCAYLVALELLLTEHRCFIHTILRMQSITHSTYGAVYYMTSLIPVHGARVPQAFGVHTPDGLLQRPRAVRLTCSAVAHLSTAPVGI